MDRRSLTVIMAVAVLATGCTPSARRVPTDVSAPARGVVTSTPDPHAREAAADPSPALVHQPPDATAVPRRVDSVSPADETTGEARIAPSGASLVYDFRTGAHGWTADVADYPISVGPSISFEAGLRRLPDTAPPGSTGTAFLLSSYNTPDDLFTFMKRQIRDRAGLLPLQDYRVRYRMRFLSDAPSGCFGIGGAPGESVYLKAGGSAREPKPVRVGADIELNLPKGDQAQPGGVLSVAGDVANGIPCEEVSSDRPLPLGLVEREVSHIVRTDRRGRLWLLVGTDSGYEGATTLYFQTIEVTLTALAK
jgi:hypothetical protein